MFKGPMLRVGIIGTGVMGGHHTRVASMMPGFQLVGIYDANLARAEEVAQQYGVEAFASQQALCDAVEAVIIATPTVTHAEVATACLQAGVHVLLEKPIAASLAEAEALADLSARTDRVLLIGHVERFNPAVTALLPLLHNQELFACELQRLSTSMGRDRSADIIFDLMIHDLDLALAFTGSNVVAVNAMGHRIRSGLIDHVTALLRFESGITATLTASGVSQERIRQARLYTQNAQFTVNFASREVSIHRHGKSSIAQENGQYYVTSQVEQILVPNREPLVIEQEHFLHAIRDGIKPLIDAQAGLQALRLAYTIQERVKEQLSITA
ncbi:MAG TPA: Gfo/Idh/MocA family oxidoreductase [Armatimonadota bacterium]|jgi:virulence factor